jgi:hypothetical protein
MSDFQEADRVRRSTSSRRLREIDQQIEENIRYFSAQPDEAISRRIRELEHEWSMERYIEVNASSLALTGVILGATVNRKFLVIPLLVAGFLLQHAIQGWCPPIPVFRAWGIRTRSEIEREKYGLKALRGDFNGLSSDEVRREPARILQAVTT